MDNCVKTIQIDLNIKPSKDLGRKLVLTLFDYLLHSRSQIPFHFELFKKFVESKTKAIQDFNGGSEKKYDWKIEKQLKLAADTYERICSLKQLIEIQFTGGCPMMILFGNTIHTVKESYQILFPVNGNHVSPSFINESNVIKMILLQIIQHDELKSTDQHLLPTTNVFVLFRHCSPLDHNELNPLTNFRLAKSCKKFSIEFNDSFEFDIFEEGIKDMSLSEKPSDEFKEEGSGTWYQAKAYVKGFKDILVNNKSIWN